MNTYGQIVGGTGFPEAVDGRNPDYISMTINLGWKKIDGFSANITFAYNVHDGTVYVGGSLMTGAGENITPNMTKLTAGLANDICSEGVK